MEGGGGGGWHGRVTVSSLAGVVLAASSEQERAGRWGEGPPLFCRGGV